MKENNLIKNKKILITGVSGMIGYQSAKYLSELGYSVLGIYNSNLPKNSNWENLKIDLINENLVDILKNEVFDIIVHCAAVIPKSFNETDYLLEQNTKIDQNIFDYIEKNKTKLIYISSTSLYAKSQEKIDENSVIEIKDFYSKVKLNSEKKTMNLSEKNIILRINAPYSPLQSNRTVLKIFIENALNNKNLSYFGEGNRMQDFTHAKDIALSILKSVEKDDIGGIFNISYGNAISMRDLTNLVFKLTPNCKSEIIPAGIEDEQENYKASFSIEKAIKILDWNPFISIENGIKDWINYLENENSNYI